MGRWRTFQVISGTVALLDVDNVVVGFVALVARVVGRPEPDVAEVTAEYEQRSVDDGHDETFAVCQRVTHCVQTAVHSRCHVSTVSCPDADWAVLQPFDCKQSGRRPFKTIYYIFRPYVRYNIMPRQLIGAYVSPSERFSWRTLCKDAVQEFKDSHWLSLTGVLDARRKGKIKVNVDLYSALSWTHL